MRNNPSLGRFQPNCILAHGLINKLSIIVGYCDILHDEVEPGSHCEKKLQLIRETAEGMAELINHHQCDLEDLLFREGVKKSPRFC